MGSTYLSQVATNAIDDDPNTYARSGAGSMEYAWLSVTLPAGTIVSYVAIYRDAGASTFTTPLQVYASNSAGLEFSGPSEQCGLISSVGSNDYGPFNVGCADRVATYVTLVIPVPFSTIRIGEVKVYTYPPPPAPHMGRPARGLPVYSKSSAGAWLN